MITDRRLLRASLLLVLAAACDAPAITPPAVPDCTGTLAPIPGDAYCPTTLAPFIYHWDVGRNIAVFVDTSHSQPDANLTAGVRDGIAAWEAIGLLGDIHLHVVSNMHDADVLVRFNTAPSLVTSDSCQIIDFGAGGNTFFCVPDPTAPVDEPFGFADGTPGHVKMLVTMNRAKFTSADQFHSAVAHELGHVLGIGAHSPIQTDLMFGIPLVPKPSTADAQTLRYVLSLKPAARFERAKIRLTFDDRRMKREDALDYHARGRPGKIEVVATKPLTNQRDLALAYSPGVAEPCIEIKRNPEDVYKYTAKGNLVAVVTNGTAVLGLGNIGALAGKPVMEGKANLFKQFADLDVFDLEVGSQDPDDMIKFCQLLEPTVGGINLEDIRAPDCFYIERELRRTLNIPVFHDDQHGTAIISGAALLNALEVVGKSIEDVHVVFSGAGAAAIATAEHYVRLGVRRERIILCDREGVVYVGRPHPFDEWKARFATTSTARTLEDALDGADVFVGLSVAGALSATHIAKMGTRPIIFALANPVPEILPNEVHAVRPDAIVATGRSDFPNQVNNVLGFPFIFRGALDVRAREINEDMKMAATRSLAALAKEDVPDSVTRLYGLSSAKFGPEYLIPFAFDPRALLWVAPAIAWAAVGSGVARNILDMDEYRDQLETRLGKARGIMRGIIHRAHRDPKKVVFPEGDEPKILKAAQILVDDGIAQPVLLGSESAIRRMADERHITLEGITIVDPARCDRRDDYALFLWRRRQRKGLSVSEAHQLLSIPNYFGSVMVAVGDADALVSGVNMHYPETIRPALEVIGAHPKAGLASSVYMLVFEKRVIFCGDTTVNIDPTAEQLAQIAIGASGLVSALGITPRVAMLSFSNFGSVNHPAAHKVAEAVRILRQRAPNLEVDGEMQADTAFDETILTERYPFSALKSPANVLIFPNLSAGNIAYKLLARLGGATAIGPILVGMNRPVHVLEQGADVEQIVNMAAVAVIDSQERSEFSDVQRTLPL